MITWNTAALHINFDTRSDICSDRDESFLVVSPLLLECPLLAESRHNQRGNWLDSKIYKLKVSANDSMQTLNR